MAQELSDIRKQIDAIDNSVHDLLMERAALVSSVAAAKRKEGLQIVQPAREARMIRRLLARHQSPLPEATIVRIWRELVGSVSLLQTGMTVAVAARDGECAYWDMAKDYFGSAIPMRKINGNSNAVASVKDDEASFAVLPWPEIEEKNPWWVHLLGQGGDKMSIICGLPYARERVLEANLNHRAVVVSKIEFMPSDDDNSFIGLKLNTDVSRAKISEFVERAGFKLLNIYSAQSMHEGLDFHLVEVGGFVTSAFDELGVLRELLGDLCLFCDVMGGYPVIPELKKTPLV